MNMSSSHLIYFNLNFYVYAQPVFTANVGNWSNKFLNAAIMTRKFQFSHSKICPAPSDITEYKKELQVDFSCDLFTSE